MTSLTKRNPTFFLSSCYGYLYVSFHDVSLDLQCFFLQLLHYIVGYHSRSCQFAISYSNHPISLFGYKWIRKICKIQWPQAVQPLENWCGKVVTQNVVSSLNLLYLCWTLGGSSIFGMIQFWWKLPAWQCLSLKYDYDFCIFPSLRSRWL